MHLPDGTGQNTLRLPKNLGFDILTGTIGKIEIDEILIGYPCLLAQALEVFNLIDVQMYGNLFLQLFYVRIPCRS